MDKLDTLIVLLNEIGEMHKTTITHGIVELENLENERVLTIYAERIPCKKINLLVLKSEENIEYIRNRAAVILLNNMMIVFLLNLIIKLF